MTAPELVRLLVQCGVREASITDHDALGAYPEALGIVPESVLRILPGIEVDAEVDGQEVHIIGLGVSTGPSGLRDHIDRVQQQRRVRIAAEIDEINRLLGPGTLERAEVMAPVRQTLMRPHLIRPLLARGHFPGPDAEARYRAAQHWLHQNVRPGARVCRPGAAEAIALIRAAGGRSFLAHPGYCVARGLVLEDVLRRLRAEHLDGVEAEYAYFKPFSPEFPDRPAQESMIGRIKEIALSLGLETSCGSDGHDPEGVRYFHSMYPG